MSSSSSHVQLVILPSRVAVDSIRLAIFPHLLLIPILIVMKRMWAWGYGGWQRLTRTVRAAAFATVGRILEAVRIVIVLAIVFVVAVGSHVCDGRWWSARLVRMF